MQARDMKGKVTNLDSFGQLDNVCLSRKRKVALDDILQRRLVPLDINGRAINRPKYLGDTLVHLLHVQCDGQSIHLGVGKVGLWRCPRCQGLRRGVILAELIDCR